MQQTAGPDWLLLTTHTHTELNYVYSYISITRTVTLLSTVECVTKHLCFSIRVISLDLPVCWVYWQRLQSSWWRRWATPRGRRGRRSSALHPSFFLHCASGHRHHHFEERCYRLDISDLRKSLWRTLSPSSFPPFTISLAKKPILNTWLYIATDHI